jgi:hypothetical protein
MNQAPAPDDRGTTIKVESKRRDRVSESVEGQGFLRKNSGEGSERKRATDPNQELRRIFRVTLLRLVVDVGHAESGTIAIGPNAQDKSKACHGMTPTYHSKLSKKLQGK